MNLEHGCALVPDNLPPLPEPMGYVPFAGEFYQAAELDQEVKDDAETVWCFSMQQMRAYAEEAVRLEREAILKAVDDLEEPAWYGYENPNNFDDGKRAALAAVRARSEVAPDPAER